MTVTTSAALGATRDSWHRVAEHVLAAGQFAAAGTIRLRPCPGGLQTVVGVQGRQLAVVGDRLLVTDGSGVRSAPLTTLRAAAEVAGVTPGLRGSYSPATSPDLDAPLPIDRSAAARLASWYALGDAALRLFADDLGAAQDPVLWPEHLDVGVTVDAVNYGCSPGDAAIDEPYLYVGPHDGPPRRDEFWNQPFGAAAASDRIRATGDAVDFFHHGRVLLEGSTT